MADAGGAATAGPVPATHWYAGLPAPALEASALGTMQAGLRRYLGTPPDVQQPALTDNVLVLHLGGAKRVHRWQGGRQGVWDMEHGSLTLIPTLQGNRWVTEGPVAYAHLTFSMGLLAQFAREELDRNPTEVALLDQVGVQAPLVSHLFAGLLRDVEDGRHSRLYRDSLLSGLMVNLLRDHSTLSGRVPAAAQARGEFAGWQLRRVVDHMAEHLGAEIGVADLVGLTGLSRAQFFRAFRQSTGSSPHRYLTAMRITHAKGLLQAGGMSVAQAARSVGFGRTREFAAAFRRQEGVSPRLFRVRR